ncbi:hypothetical protein [Deinococcus hopiensis]|uniref:hypothetical protein n=1 Tax=Deinococcus hopiensis TaxID=309885 RepID=UPI000A06F306|nr:hypothetical protein [Deinococcus hopiensis]
MAAALLAGYGPFLADAPHPAGTGMVGETAIPLQHMSGAPLSPLGLGVGLTGLGHGWVASGHLPFAKAI